MTASNKERKNIEEHLPHDLLKELYLNSRVSIKQLEKKFGISHHTLSKCLKKIEKDCELKYTLDINTDLLGFSEPRIVLIKFEGMPEREKLIKKLTSYKFIQNAYIASGNFDLILHVICPSAVKYAGLEYKMRIELNRYKPIVKVVTVNKEIIQISQKINKNDKKLLCLLLDNSRMKIKDLSKKSGLSQMKIIYGMKKLQKDGIIRKFSTLIQKPDKSFLLFLGVSTIPTEKHFNVFFKNLVTEILKGENKNNLSTDYSVVSGTSGCFDFVSFACFKDGNTMSDRGPQLIENLWRDEYAKVEKSILIEVLLGKWPFTSNSYIKWGPMLEDLKNGITYEASTYQVL
jgi:DNA-binding Lrp family transcriptional regulator